MGRRRRSTRRGWWIAGGVMAAFAVVAAAVIGFSPGPASSSTSDAGGSTAVQGHGITRTASPFSSASASPSTSPSPSASPSPSPTSASPTAADTGDAPAAAAAGFRTVTFVNDVQQTIWVAGGEQTAQPALATTGWVLPAGQSVTISVPDHWNGRFWGRTGCSFDGSGSGSCVTGDCGGRFQCTGYGRIPATLAEFNLNSFDNLDFYDVSMVDGSNLPMYINITSGGTTDKISSTGCVAAGCTTPVQCPAALVVDGGAGCESPCGVFGTDQYCCRGQWSSRAACDPTQWPVDYAAVFKTAEPYAYSYSDDDATSTFTCSDECDYRITFGVTP